MGQVLTQVWQTVQAFSSRVMVGILHDTSRESSDIAVLRIKDLRFLVYTSPKEANACSIRFRAWPLLLRRSSLRRS
jgi:hypothetical protein